MGLGRERKERKEARQGRKGGVVVGTAHMITENGFARHGSNDLISIFSCR